VLQLVAGYSHRKLKERRFRNRLPGPKVSVSLSPTHRICTYNIHNNASCWTEAELQPALSIIILSWKEIYPDYPHLLRSWHDFLGRRSKVPRRNILRHVKRTLRIMTDILRSKNERTFLVMFLPASLLVVCWYFPELWWMNREWLEIRWRRIMAAVHGTLYTIPPRNQ
jgi:hypothetical protein